MKADKYKITGKIAYHTGDFPTDSKKDKVDKNKILAKTAENQEKISAFQDKLYADGREGLIIILQAMDAAGKDGTVKHVMSGINPQGVDVCNFKQPSSEELAHDFLWRVNKCIPARGKIGLFNRSYYEDVLVVQVHEMNKGYHMASRVIDQKTRKFFKKRYEHIKNYEEYLYDNSYRIVKIFLNVSKEEQKKRFLERIDNPDKNWKFSSSDIKERGLWDDYQKVYEDVINETSSKECPWYVLPADDKWYTRYLVSEIILNTLEEMDPQYPVMSDEERSKLAGCKAQLLAEKAAETKKKITEETETKTEPAEKVSKVLKKEAKTPKKETNSASAKGTKNVVKKKTEESKEVKKTATKKSAKTEKQD